MLSKTLTLVSALLFTALVAIAATESNASRPVTPLSSATIHCLGSSSVPMTVDAEQRPPLRVVGDLPCGSVVSVLADNEGHTAEVRTEEGVDGYVARLYLTENGVIASAGNPQPISASPADGVVRWRSGSPGCAQFVTNGHLVESATANAVTVQVALEDTGWKLRTIVAVSNNGRETIEVLSSLVTLDEVSPGLKSLPPSDPLKLSHVVNHQLLLSEANALPPSDADTHLDSTQGLMPAAYQP